MTGLFHALHVCTLATWLSLSGFGYVGLAFVGGSGQRPVIRELEAEGPEIFELSLDDDMRLGGEEARSGEEESFSEEEELMPAEDLVPEEFAEVPPELAELAEEAPLPDLPEIPLAKPQPRPEVAERRPAPARRQPTSNPNTRSGRPGGTGTAARETGSGGRGGEGAGMSQGQRLAGGRRPPPYYPASSRRAGEEGSVVISLTIGDSGHVTAARIVRPCSYPALNESALNAVRRWKFKPGPVVTTTQTITFRLK